MKKARHENPGNGGFRLNRYLASCGLGSRRNVEILVTRGRVTINGVTITTPAARVSEGDLVEVDGMSVEPREKLYVLFNKPPGYVCSVRDTHNRTIFDILPAKYAKEGTFPVGRLDKMSEGLLILTNDGQLALGLTHPREGQEKTYDVLVSTPVGEHQLALLKKGTFFQGKRLRPARVLMLERKPRSRWIRFVLKEGVKREIRHITNAAGLQVERLVRVAIGKCWLETLKPGEWVETSKDELISKINQGGTI